MRVTRALGVAGIGLGVVVLGMTWSVVNTALAVIQREMGAGVGDLQWMMNAFGIGICVPLLVMGKVGDAWGRKWLFVGGLLGALVAAAMGGFAQSMGWLIAAMAVFGLAGSVILPMSQALLVHQFPEGEKGKAVGLWSIFASLSLAAGPLVGGAILEMWGWRWIYLMNVPVVLVAIPLVGFFVVRDEGGERVHCDWGGVLLLAVVVVSLVVGIMQAPNWDTGVILGLFAVALFGLCAFVGVELRTSRPLFRPDLFLQRSFIFSAVPNGCMMGFIWVSFFLIPLYLQNMRGFTPLETGATLLLVTLPVAVLSVPVGRWFDRSGAKRLLFWGFSFLILSAFIQILFAGSKAFWPIGVGCFALGMGWVLVWGPSISCALSALPHRLAGIASGMFTTIQELGAIVSLAIAGVFFRETQEHLLEPQMEQIEGVLNKCPADQMQLLLSNPAAIEGQVGINSPILPWLRDAFLGGYQAAFWFLLALSIFALLMSLFLKEKKRA